MPKRNISGRDPQTHTIARQRVSLDRDHYKHLFANRLAKARKAAGLSQTEAARAMGMGQSAMSKIENGERHVELFRAINMAALYGTSVTDLMRAVRESEGVSETEQDVIDRAFLGGE